VPICSDRPPCRHRGTRYPAFLFLDTPHPVQPPPRSSPTTEGIGMPEGEIYEKDRKGDIPIVTESNRQSGQPQDVSDRNVCPVMRRSHRGSSPTGSVPSIPG
jgi:hypothetical protein